MRTSPSNMKLIYLALLCPVGITVIALLVQAYFWYSDMLHPLMTFNGAAIYNEMLPLMGTSASDSISLRNDNFKLESNFGLENIDDVYLKYVIHMVAVSSKDMTTHQSNVVRSIRKHLHKTLDLLQHPSIEFKVIQSKSFGDELNNLTSYQQTEDENGFGAHLSIHDVSTYIFSSDSVYHRSTGQMLGCIPSTNCKVLTFAYFIPDFSDHARMHSAEFNSTSNSIQYKTLRLIDTTIADTSSSHPSDVISGLVAPQQGCFSILDLESKQHYNPVDANTIYNAATNTMQCLQTLLDIPDHHHNNTIAVHDNACVDNDTCSAEKPSAMDTDYKLTFSATQLRQFQRKRIVRILHDALFKLQTLVRVHGYNNDILALLTLSTPQSHAYMQIFEMVKELKTTLAAKDSGSNCVASPTCVHNIHTLVHKLYTLVIALDTDPAGGLKAPAPIEQYFAIFGPYWLPIVVPVYRALRSMTYV